MKRKAAASEPRSVREEIEAWRARLQLTQVQAANRLRVSVRTYEGWVLGRGARNPDMVLRLAWHEEGCPPDTEPRYTEGTQRRHPPRPHKPKPVPAIFFDVIRK